MKCLIFVFILSAFFACKKEDVDSTNSDKNLSIKFNLKSNAENLIFDNYVAYEDDSIKLSDFKFYLSDIKLIGPSSTTLVSDEVLIDLSAQKEYKFSVKSGNYTSFSYAIGIPTPKNASDPSVYENNHALSIFQGMHWNWNSGYKFIMLEGKLKNNQEEFLLAYHTGTDTLYTEKIDTINIEIPNDQSLVQLNFSIAIEKIIGAAAFSPINTISETNTHTMDNFSLANKITLNLKSELKTNK
jgi:hypothetical protein